MNSPRAVRLTPLLVACGLLGCGDTSSLTTAGSTDAAESTDTAEPTELGAPVDTPSATPDALDETDSSPGDVESVDAVEPPLPDDLDMAAADFPCLKTGTKVRNFYVWNLTGRIDETLDVANAANGGTYPVGTLIQLVPTEAMVKRKAGFSPATKDWEFFALEVRDDGSTTIVARGAEETQNQFGGNCAECHGKAEPQWDFVCEGTHGCDPLPLTNDLIQIIQNSDPRCPK
ncbi:MAG: hypothetical protein IV100_11000 [Myxococcales bacterium]|nr:hypothetical protein [Myxococcales bacterium]